MIYSQSFFRFAQMNLAASPFSFAFLLVFFYI